MMNDHIHKWEQNKYFECAIQCTECKKIVGDNEVVNLVNALTAELEAVKRERDALREALKQAADELWGKHYRTAKTEWATDDVAKHYADKLVDNYRTIAKEARQK